MAFTDFNNLATNYTGPTGSGKEWRQGDFNGDGDVDFGDFTELASNYTGFTGYWKGKSGGGLSEAQRADLLSSLEGTDPSRSRAAEVEDALALSRVRSALARLTTLRARNAAGAGSDSVAAHDLVVEGLGAEESETPRTSSSRMAWVHQFEPMGMKERPAKAGNSVRSAVDALLAIDSR